MKTTADALYPGFSRKIYLNAYRFSLHMLPRSTLIEVGAQTNTKAEIWNAMEPLAKSTRKRANGAVGESGFQLEKQFLLK